MKRTLITSFAVVIAVTLSSCGSNKKLASAQNDIAQLEAKNNELGKNLSELQSEAASLEKRYNAVVQDYNAYKKNAEAYKQECEANNEKLQYMREALQEEIEVMERMEEKLEEAMANFKDKGVDVYIEDGIVRVSLTDNLLYKSGSSKLSDDGKKALESLAAVLNNDYPNLKVIVIGNTDDVQFKKGIDNWTLSTERANGVVRTLRDEYKVSPERLTAAGKSKYNPVADNSTADGRARNRRTDIILNPNLAKLWQSAREGD